MIDGDPHENVRLANAAIAALKDQVDARRAAQILAFAAVLVLRSNHIIESPTAMMSNADAYLKNIRDDIQSRKRRGDA